MSELYCNYVAAMPDKVPKANTILPVKKAYNNVDNDVFLNL